MNKIVKAILLFVFLMAGFFVGTKALANPKKPKSRIEFGITKHAGLHYVNGGFKLDSLTYNKYEVGVYNNVKAIVKINTMWTWQSDGDVKDNVDRTQDLLSEDWFHAKKFPLAKASIKRLPISDVDNVEIELQIKGTTKLIKAKVRNAKLLFRITLKDFNLAPSWKGIFAGNFADVIIKLEEV